MAIFDVVLFLTVAFHILGIIAIWSANLLFVSDGGYHLQNSLKDLTSDVFKLEIQAYQAQNET